MEQQNVVAATRGNSAMWFVLICVAIASLAYAAYFVTASVFVFAPSLIVTIIAMWQASYYTAHRKWITNVFLGVMVAIWVVHMFHALRG